MRNVCDLSLVFLVVTVFLAPRLAHAQAGGPESSGAARALIEAYQREFSRWVQAVSTETDPAKRDALIERRPAKGPLAEKLLDIGRADNTSADSEMALIWVYVESEADDLRSTALAALLDRPALTDQVAGLLQMFERDSHSRARDALAQLHKAGPTPEVRLSAAMSLASWLLAYEEESQQEARQLFESVVESGNDHRLPQGMSLVEAAQARLFELDRLGIGMLVPDIAGEDLTGAPLHIRDYRGQVILLTFWAHWCTGCMQQAQSEREFLRTFADKPFTVLGVNADLDSPQQIQKANQRASITWRSFRNDNPRGPIGSIARQWNVQTLPTTYLIDHQGHIRAKWIGTIAEHDDLRTHITAALEAAQGGGG